MTFRRLIIGFGAIASAALLGVAGHAQLNQAFAPAPAPAFAPQGGFFGGGNNGEQELVAQFDKDKDGRLNRTERDAARAATGGRQFGGFRRGGRFNQADGQPGRRLAPADVRPYPTTPIYDTATMRTMFLQFADEDWEDELAAFHNTDVEVPATMVVDGRTYKDVGVHFRGASSFMMVPEGLKRSLNVSTDFAVEDQELGGYRTFNLLNANNDPTFLRAFLYTEIARKYIPVPKMNFMRVVINGESWGVYLNTQQYNGDFLRDYFKTTKGARWKAPGRPGGRLGLEYLGENISTYRELFEIKTKDDEESWKALVELTRVLNQTPPDKLEAALAPLLDIDGVLRFLAVDVALVNSDGYWTRASDYSFYRDPEGKFHVIPHDVNEGLGGEGGRGFGGGGTALDPLIGLNDQSKPLRSKLLAVPALREKYLGYVRDIATQWLDWKAIEPTVRAAHGLIADEVRRDTRKLYDTPGFEAAIAATGNSLKDFFDERRAYLLNATSNKPTAVRATVPPAAGNSLRAAN